MDKFKLYNDMVVEVDEQDEQNFSELDKMRMKKGINKMKNNKNKTTKLNNLQKFVAAGIVATVAIGATPVAASYLSRSLSDALEVSSDLANYSTVVGQSVINKGITVTLDEVILDGNTLVVLTTIEQDTPMNLDHTFYNTDVYINGEKITLGSTGSLKPIGDYMAQELTSYNINSDIDLSGNVDVKIVYSMAEYEPVPRAGTTDEFTLVPIHDVSEGWIFEFTTSGDDLMQETQVYPINKQFTIGESTVDISHLSINAAGAKLYYDKTGNSNISVEGVDNFGNIIYAGEGSYRAGHGGYTYLNADIPFEEMSSITLNLLLSEDTIPVMPDFEESTTNVVPMEEGERSLIPVEAVDAGRAVWEAPEGGSFTIELDNDLE